MTQKIGVVEASQRFPLLNTQKLSVQKPHAATKLLWDVMLAVILAVIAAVVVDMALHAPTSRASGPNGCDATFSEVEFSGALFRCDDPVAKREEVWI